MTDTAAQKYDLRITLAADDGTGEGPVRFVGPFERSDDAVALAETWKDTSIRRVPAGTRYTIVEHEPDREHRDPRPPIGTEELALRIPDLPAGQGFPDTLDVLCAVYGPQHGTLAWSKANDVVAGWAHMTARERQWADRFAPLTQAADITRANALRAGEDDAGSAEHRMWVSLTGVFDQTLACSDDVPVPMLAYLIKLAEAVNDSEEEARDAAALQDAVGSEPGSVRPAI